MKAPTSGGGGEQGVHVCVIHCPLPFPGAHWRVVCVPEHPHHRVLPGDHLQHRLLPAPVGSGIGPSAYVPLHACISICVCVGVSRIVCVCVGVFLLAEVVWGMVLNRAITIHDHYS